MMVSPDNASEMACPMVLQAVVGDKQLFVSFPFPPFTYHVVLAKAAGARAENRAKSSKVLIVSLCFIIFLLLAAGKNVVVYSGTSGPRQSGRAVPIKIVPWVRTIAHRKGVGAPSRETGKVQRGRVI